MICRNNRGKQFVRHFYAKNYDVKLIDETNPSIGLSKIEQLKNKTHAICSFTRLNEMPKTVKNYYLIRKNERPYMIHAFGFG